MPMYEYRCTACNKTHERFRSSDNRRKASNCPDCGSVMNFIEFPQDTTKANPREHVKDVFRKV